MNTVATIEKPSPVDAYRMQVLPPEKLHSLGLPRHVSPERFERNLANALMQTPDLMKCDPRLTFREVSKAAALGLLLDPQLGEAYLIIGWNGRARREEPQLRVGYRGLMKLARQSGEVKNIYAHEVCANDKFHCILGDSKSLHHEPDVFGERGSVVGYYAVALFNDGSSDFEAMSVADIHKIRDRAEAWKAFTAGKIKSTPWSTDDGEMSKKTVIRRLQKRLPQSPELADAIRIEDEAEAIIDQRPAALSAPPPPPVIGSAQGSPGAILITQQPVDDISDTGSSELDPVDDAGNVVDEKASSPAASRKESTESTVPADAALAKECARFINDCANITDAAALATRRVAFGKITKGLSEDQYRAAEEAYAAAVRRIKSSPTAGARDDQPEDSNVSSDEILAEAIDHMARCRTADELETIYAESDWEAELSAADGFVEKLRDAKAQQLGRIERMAAQNRGAAEQEPALPSPPPPADPASQPDEGQSEDAAAYVSDFLSRCEAVRTIADAMSVHGYWKETSDRRFEMNIPGPEINAMKRSYAEARARAEQDEDTSA